MSSFKINEVANIVRDSGGKIVGRTRLQKIAYLLTATGLDDNFRFTYKHYGPFSEQLASSAKIGALLGGVNERQNQAAWGGTYSTYTLNDVRGLDESSARYQLASRSAGADSIELELAATALFLHYDGYGDPWGETAQRKSEKSTPERLANAKALLADLAMINLPCPIPPEVLQ